MKDEGGPMTPPEYVRPTPIPDALAALRGGTALAGGTTLARRARQVSRLVDLQALGLDRLYAEGDRIRLGTMLRLQQIVEADLPDALCRAAALEAGLNLRNLSTLGGALMTCTGRSPLVTALLALHAQVRMEPGPQQWSLDDLLTRRGSMPSGMLLTSVEIGAPMAMAHASVARSPADRPIVVAVMARLAGRVPSFGVALGGFGPQPILVPQAELALTVGDVKAAVEAGRSACAGAGDAWASAAYRAEVAAALLRRLAGEVGV
jgi:CO/xanthine dehydrogenase FAD-binding subunit